MQLSEILFQEGFWSNSSHNFYSRCPVTTFSAKQITFYILHFTFRVHSLFSRSLCTIPEHQCPLSPVPRRACVHITLSTVASWTYIIQSTRQQLYSLCGLFGGDFWPTHICGTINHAMGQLILAETAEVKEGIQIYCTVGIVHLCLCFWTNNGTLTRPTCANMPGPRNAHIGLTKTDFAGGKQAWAQFRGSIVRVPLEVHVSIKLLN